MRTLLTTAALLVLIASPPAIAQTGGGAGSPAGATNPSGSSSTTTGKRAPLPAPVGHRQPRADEVPPPAAYDERDPNDPIAREDAALDRKIKSICRGC